MKNKSIFYIIFIICLASSCSEKKYFLYSNLENLSEQETSWIPFFLVENPNIKKQVFDIYEKHDLDTNESWGKFSIVDKDCILEQSEKIEQKYPLNLTKAKKILFELGCGVDISNCIYIYNKKSVYILILDKDKNVFYYFGKLGIKS